MGLDMYLYRDTFVKNYPNQKAKEKHTVTVKGTRAKAINPKRVTSVREEVMYWRKANAIHKWFVDNVQDGRDECQLTHVPTEKLNELLDICQKVTKTPALAKMLLPTQSGFFFGETDYDEYYFEDVKETADELAKVLKEGPEGNYYYQSSW